MLYDELFHKLEKVRWSLQDDIPWSKIDHSQISEEDLLHIRRNCLTELSALYAEEMFIRDFYHDIDFCQFMSIWYYEEMKHFLVLKEYLKRFNLAPTEAEMKPLRLTFAPANWVDTLAMHFCGEQRLGMWYTAWARYFKEPVIKKIYETIAGDEFRHAAAYFQFMKKAVAQSPETLKRFLLTSLFMLRNPEGDKHPTSLKVNGPDEPSVIELLDDPDYIKKMADKTVQPEDVKRTENRILSLLSSLAGTKFRNQRDVIAFAKGLA